jgi:hypothetical protein
LRLFFASSRCGGVALERATGFEPGDQEWRASVGAQRGAVETYSAVDLYNLAMALGEIMVIDPSRCASAASRTHASIGLGERMKKKRHSTKNVSNPDINIVPLTPTWTAFLQAIEEAKRQLAFEKDEECFFRGHRNVTYELLPTLLRETKG